MPYRMRIAVMNASPKLPRQGNQLMDKIAKEALQVTKEIVVKFIETSRVSPSNFSEIFPSVYRVVLETLTRPNTGTGQISSQSRDHGDE